VWQGMLEYSLFDATSIEDNNIFYSDEQQPLAFSLPLPLSPAVSNNSDPFSQDFPPSYPPILPQTTEVEEVLPPPKNELKTNNRVTRGKQTKTKPAATTSSSTQTRSPQASSPTKPIPPTPLPSVSAIVTAKPKLSLPERESQSKERKQQHQQKDKERRHKINEGLKQLGNLLQDATGTSSKLDQPSIVSTSITYIETLQSEIALVRQQLAAIEAKAVVKQEHPSDARPSLRCPVFHSVSDAQVGLVSIRADDLCIVDANVAIAHVLGYADPGLFIGSAVWDRPLHSRLYQLDMHGRVTDKGGNPFAAKEGGPDETAHIDCLWEARTITNHILSARVSLSVHKGCDVSQPTHFLLCSLPAQRTILAAPSR